MYKCIHCKKEQPLCKCQTPFKTYPYHDMPGMRRTQWLSWLRFELPPPKITDAITQFLDEVKFRVQTAMMIPSDKLPFVKSQHQAARQRRWFFDAGKLRPPYRRTKHRESKS